MQNRTIQRRTLALSIMASLALASAAWAHGDKFKTMDSNGDGMVSAAEHAAGAKAMFEKMDANHDGSVSAAEMDAGHKLMMKDRDDDMHGMKAGQKAKSEKAMAGKDAAGTAAADRDMAQDKSGAMMDHGMGHDMPGERMDHGMGMEGMKMSSAGMIAKMDSNGDGMLSAAEHDAGAAAMFKQMDTDGDGSLSRKEMQAGHADMMKKAPADTAAAPDKGT